MLDTVNNEIEGATPEPEKKTYNDEMLAVLKIKDELISELQKEKVDNVARVARLEVQLTKKTIEADSAKAIIEANTLSLDDFKSSEPDDVIRDDNDAYAELLKQTIKAQRSE